MIISDMVTSSVENTIKLSVTVDSSFVKENKLWFSVNEEYQNYLCDTRYDAFLVGLLYPAMRYGEDIHVEGTVSKKLLFNINHFVIPLIKSFSSACKTIKVSASHVTSDRFDGEGVGTGFSGGIDSFCTIYDHFYLEQDPEYRINAFLFLNVGAHGSVNEASVKEKFKIRYDYLKAFPEEVGLDFIPVDSNLFLFHPWGHQLTCTLTLVSGVLFLQKYFSKYYCASLGWSYMEILKYHATDLDRDIAMLDPILLPLLGTECIEFLADGTQYTRSEKTMRIVNYEPVYKYLNVCVSGEDTHENCSVCGKCARTLMTINSLNQLDAFSHLFDIEKYRKVAEKKYVRKQIALQHKDPFAKGNVELAKTNKIKLPNYLYCMLRHGIENVPRRIYLGLRKILPANFVERARDFLKLSNL